MDSKYYKSFIMLSVDNMDRYPALWAEDVEAALRHSLLLARQLHGE